MLLDNGFDWVHVYLAMPIFGSRLYEICKEKGYIDNPNSDDFVATKSVIRAPGIDPEALETYAYETQLRVNFVENYNIKIGRHEVALPYLKNVVEKYPGHAFGHLYLSKCHAAMGDPEKAADHHATAQSIFDSDSWWRGLADRLKAS
jgi:tetratricopeptide (TPR) repeat protein